MGRPPLPPEDRKQYQRMAVYKQTHNRIARLAKKYNKDIVEYVDDLVPKD